MAVQKEFKNLTARELVYADHYAETGNSAGLREMAERSARRERSGEVTRVIDRRDRMDDWRAEAGL